MNTERSINSKLKVLWLNDEISKLAIDQEGNVNKERFNYIVGIIEDLISLIGRDSADHTMQPFLYHVKELKERVGDTKGKPIVALDTKTLPLVIDPIRSRIFEVHLSRVRDIVDPNLKTKDLIMTRGNDAIQKLRDINEEIIIYDDISFTGNTITELIKKLNEIGCRYKSIKVAVIGITKNATSKIKSMGENIEVVSGFIIDDVADDAWHTADLFTDTKTEDGKVIKASDLIKMLIPVFKGEESFNEFIERNRIPKTMRNPNLFLLLARDDSPLSKQLSKEGLLESFDKVYSIVVKIEEMMNESNKQAVNRDLSIEAIRS
ncbi:MAG: hypothetical protein ARM1_0299 [Candidatus Micrarchaeota archaeon]|nr:MAG: hypothetical protein ARM1_0299 [Candidatus Micrarchaeota archaeon]